jgi:erythromycin esterase
MMCRVYLLLIMAGLACRPPRPAAAGATLPATAEALTARPLRSDADLDTLVAAMGSAHTVLLGESTHGTSEFYRLRDALSRRLIATKSFRALCLEGDWADLRRLDSCIRDDKQDSASVRSVLRSFRRWPTWLWANEEFLAFAQWLQAWNRNLPPEQKVGVYGLDLFGFADAGRSLGGNKVNPEFSAALSSLLSCLQPYYNDALAYERAVRAGATCEGAATRFRAQWEKGAPTGPWIKASFLQQQSAATLLDGERYFRSRVHEPNPSWNLRDRHMQESILRLRRWLGADARILVWAHNTHVGNAAGTDMPARGRTNLGALLREAYGEKDVFSIGFGSYRGTVLAGSAWDAPAKALPLWPAKEGSLEALLHGTGANDKILLAEDLVLLTKRYNLLQQRAVGVVFGDTYTPTNGALRWNAFVFVDSTHALRPLF